MCSPEVRLPLVEVKEESKKKYPHALKVAKIDFNEKKIISWSKNYMS